MAVKGYEEYLILKRSVEGLVNDYDKLKAEVTVLRHELDTARMELNNKNEQLKELATRYERAKFSGAILGNGEDAGMAKRRVSELVREIDKCIALLDR